MPMTRKNLKVPESLFLALRDDKPDHMSWPAYLETQCLHPDEPEDDIPPGILKIHEATEEDLEEIKRRMERLPTRTADELEARLR